MRPARFSKPGSLFIERQLPREGPSPVFIAWRPNTSQGFTDEKALLKFAAWPKSTPTGLELRQWLRSFDDETGKTPELDAAKIKAEGWGPEVHEPEPNDNTRTVI